MMFFIYLFIYFSIDTLSCRKIASIFLNESNVTQFYDNYTKKIILLWFDFSKLDKIFFFPFMFEFLCMVILKIYCNLIIELRSFFLRVMIYRCLQTDNNNTLL